MTSVNVERKATMTGHRDCVYALERHPENDKFFSGAGDGMVVQWSLKDPDNGVLIARVPNSVYTIKLDPDSDLLIVGHNYEGVHFINWESKQEIGSLKCTEGAIYAMLTFNEILFVGDSKGMLHIINIAEKKIIKSIQLSTESIRAIDINPHSQLLAIGSSDNKVRLLNLRTFEVMTELAGHTNSVFTVRFSRDFKHLLTAGRDAKLMVWNAEDNYEKINEIIAHMYTINNIEFSWDGKHFVTCSMDKSIKVWDSTNFKLLKVIDKARHAGHGTSVNRLLWLNFENTLISASDDRTISAWELEF